MFAYVVLKKKAEKLHVDVSQSEPYSISKHQISKWFSDWLKVVNFLFICLFKWAWVIDCKSRIGTQYCFEASFGRQTTFFYDLPFWHDKVHNSKDIVDFVTHIFALTEQESYSIDQLSTIFEAIAKNLEKIWRSLNVSSSLISLLIVSKILFVGMRMIL